MTNIKYLKENNLLSAHEHFMKLSESYVPNFPEEEVDEADDQGAQDPNAMGSDPSQDPSEMGGDPSAMGSDMTQDPSMGADPSMGNDMAQDPSAMGGDPSAMGGDPSAMGNDMTQDPSMGADPSMGNDMAQDPSAMGGDPSAMGGDPSAMGNDMTQDTSMGADPIAMGGDESEGQDDGDTIDIDGLTRAQDKLNVKQNHVGMDLSKVDTKIKTLIDTIQNLQDKLDANNSEIESLKSEFEKRNPTQTEKLNLRSLDSYPFNVKPNEYWEKKARQGGYDTYSDNDEPTSKEYVITNNDVDNPTRDVADTFFKIDDDDIQTMDKLFKL